MQEWTIAISVFMTLAAATGGNAQGANLAAHHNYAGRIDGMRGAMEASIRTSWEQGTASHAILQLENPEYSAFGTDPWKKKNSFPAATLRFALSAVVRQAADGRLSQEIGDGQDGAALDGASGGTAVVIGTIADSQRRQYWQTGADAQLNYVLNRAPRTSTGAISHRDQTREYWSDGVFVGFPFIAAYGAATGNQTLLQIAYDQCRLYRDALLVPGPTGKLWAHIYSDDNKQFSDPGIWATGNGWAAMGIQQVQVTIMKTPFASKMQPQIANLTTWTKEILDGSFKALNPDNLMPTYISGGSNASDAASTAALASVAFRGAKLQPKVFGANYTTTAVKMAIAVLKGVDNLGVMNPVVDVLRWNERGVLSTEAQAFGLMMMSAWRDLIGA